MRWTVVMKPPVEQQLANLWLGAPDRPAVTSAFNKLEQMLRSDPEGIGKPAGDALRFVVDPLAVIYRVSPDDCLVEIVWIEWADA